MREGFPYVIYGAVVGGLVAAIGAIRRKYADLAVSIRTFKLIASAVGRGAAVGAAACTVMVLIYAIAKNQGEKRGLEYQQIIDLNEALNTKYLVSSIQANHEILKRVYEAINKEFGSKETKTEAAKYIYLKNKKNTFKELKNEGIDDETCRIIAEREAIMECKFFLSRYFKSSDEEAEEITTLVKNRS